jgi:putative transcriptional regulator
MTRDFLGDIMQHESLEGKLLVASPHLDDPYFSKAIIYVCAHDEGGAIGIIVNQKIGMISSKDLFLGSTYQDAIPKNKKIPLMFGGPVNTDMLLILSKKKGNDNSLISQDFAVHTDIFTFLKDQQVKKDSIEKFILAKGVAAWDAGQLDEEVMLNDWILFEPSDTLVFSKKTGDTLWSNVIKSIGIGKNHRLVHYSGSA